MQVFAWILLLQAFSIKKTLGMVSYGLGDGDTISNSISSKNQPPLYLVLISEVLLNESLYGVTRVQKPSVPY